MSAGHFRDLEAGNAGATVWFKACVEWAGVKPIVQTGNLAVQGRLQQSGEKQFLWLINPTSDAQQISVSIDGAPLVVREVMWGGADVNQVPTRDALVLAL